MNIRLTLNLGVVLLLTHCSSTENSPSLTPAPTPIVYIIPPPSAPTPTILLNVTITPYPITQPSKIPATVAPTPTITLPPTPITADIENQLKRMTVAEKVGQVMLVGIQGTRVTSETHRILTELNIGGVVLLENNISNPQNVAILTNGLQAIAQTNGKPGLFIAIDQEGGLVIRLRQSNGFTELPSSMAIAATENLQNANAMGVLIAKELKAVGINMNLAPVLDVNNNPANPIIGSRSFGSDPIKVANFGVAVLEGLQKNGVLAIGKHFPGHGDTDLDSHLALPIITHNRLRLETVELTPFRAAIAANIAGIMSAHIVFPAVEPNRTLPATLSSNVLGELLRKDLNFNGLIMTDALDMQALRQAGYSIPAASIAALNAGADILLFAQGIESYRQSHTALVTAVSSGRVSMSRLDDAVRHVLTAKSKYDILSIKPVNADIAASLVGTQAHQQQVLAVAQAAITLVRDRAKLVPLPKNKPVLVVEVPSAYGLGNYLNKKFIRISASPTPDEIQNVLRSAPGHTLVITTHNAHLYSGQTTLVQALQQSGNPFIVTALGVPYDILQFNQIPSFIAAYGSGTQPTLIALAKVLLGEATASGHLPVQLPGIEP